MILETIKNRRSVYPPQYNDAPISKKEVATILEAANWAPTHRKTEPWRFKVFTSVSKVALGNFLVSTYKATAGKPSEFKAAKIMEKAEKSQVIIAICMQRDPNESLPEWEEVAATSMAVQNMWLTAHDLKIGAYWSSPSFAKYFGEHMTLNKGETCLGFLYMGKYDGALPKGERKTTIAEKTTWL
jgi:nitroreductase